jgi:hypothetical protein
MLQTRQNQRFPIERRPGARRVMGYLERVLGRPKHIDYFVDRRHTAAAKFADDPETMVDNASWLQGEMPLRIRAITNNLAAWLCLAGQ